jgi:hypothetical protein
VYSGPNTFGIKLVQLLIFLWNDLFYFDLCRDLYSSLSIIRIIKSRRMRWAGHVARMGEKRNAYRGGMG